MSTGEARLSAAEASEGSQFDWVIDGTGSSAIVVPGGPLALTADYARDARDLTLTGQDGTRVLVMDYFTTDTPPDLATEGGAIISGTLAQTLAGPLAPAQYAQAGTTPAAAPIGTIAKIDGVVTAQRSDGSRVTLNDGSPVYQGDVIETADGAAVGIRFIDDTVFSLEGGARMALDELVYDPASKAGTASFSLVQGVFSFATGQIAKTDPDSLTIKTPVAMIGVRGTDVGVSIRQHGEESIVAVREGAIIIRNDASVQIVNEGQSVSIFGFGVAFSAVVTLSPSQFDSIFERALDYRPEQTFLQEGRGEEDGDNLGDIAPASGGDGAAGEGEINLADGEVVFVAAPVTDLAALIGEGVGSGDSDEAGGGGRDRNFIFALEDDGITNIFGTAGDDLLFGTDGDDHLFGGPGNDILFASPGNDILDGGDGFDAASYAQAPAGIIADLTAGTVSGGFPGEDRLFRIEDVFGSTFADVLTGDDADNVLIGGDGADTIAAAGGDDVLLGGGGDDLIIGGSGEGDDTIIGGDGIDTVVYTSATAGITVDLGQGTASGNASIGSDTLDGIENVIASNHDDVLIGNGDANVLSGLDGDDTLDGRAGNDTLDGGAGTDTASFAAATAAVTVDLGAGTASGDGSVGTDQLVDIENVVGSAFADDLSGDEGANDLFGEDGDDTLFGGGGNDGLFGGAGDDVIIGGSGEGDDTIDGGAGIDTVTYASATAGIIVDLAAGTATGDASIGSDSLENVENISGSDHADDIRGDGNANVLTGLAGDDTIRGRDGDDTIDGGVGNDVLVGDDAVPGLETVTATAGTSGDLTADNFDALWGGLTVTASNTSDSGNTPFSADNVGFQIKGIGANGSEAAPPASPEETGFDIANGISEQVKIDFGVDVFDVAVTFDEFFSVERGFAEQGEWIALDDGVEVARDTFINDDIDGDSQYTLDIDAGGAFDTLIFQATPYVDSDGEFQFPDPVDSSDFVIRSVEYSFERGTVFDLGSGNDLLLGGAGADDIRGGFGNDTLIGGADADTLTGGAGADTMTGGTGPDVFRYDAPDDGTMVAANVTFAESLLSGDIVVDFASGEDVFSFNAATFDAAAAVVAIGAAYDGTNSGVADGAAFVFDGATLSYDADVTAAGYTAIATVQGDAPSMNEDVVVA